jgi:hypothetical protein
LSFLKKFIEAREKREKKRRKNVRISYFTFNFSVKSGVLSIKLFYFKIQILNISFTYVESFVFVVINLSTIFYRNEKRIVHREEEEVLLLTLTIY